MGLSPHMVGLLQTMAIFTQHSKDVAITDGEADLNGQTRNGPRRKVRSPMKYHLYDSTQASEALRCSCVRGNCDSRKCRCFREKRACVGCDCMGCKNGQEARSTSVIFQQGTDTVATGLDSHLSITNPITTTVGGSTGKRATNPKGSAPGLPNSY